MGCKSNLLIILLQRYTLIKNDKLLFLLVPGAGVEPARLIQARDFKSLASTNSATRAWVGYLIYKLSLRDD